MRNILVVVGTVLAAVVVGCATNPLTVAPVGPNPAGLKNQTANGELEVYSALAGRTEGNNPTWFQHTDYTIYDAENRPVRRVNNTVGFYAKRPRTVSLPPGDYRVKAEARDYLVVNVPVVIESGRVTRIHLDDAWQPRVAARKDFVLLPSGNPVGWTASSR